MNRRRFRAATLVLSILVAAAGGAAKQKKPTQTGWAEVVNAAVEVRSKPSSGKKSPARIGAGALVATYETKQSHGAGWTQVRFANLGTLEPVTGWVESDCLKVFPTDRFPSDEDVEKALGGAYLEDVNTRYMQIARYLVGQYKQKPLLMAYIGSTFLPHTRLQLLSLNEGKWVAGEFLEFPFAQLKTGVVEIELRDLLGDGNLCLLTHEPFAQSFGASGVNLVIRRIEAGGFKTVWKAPLEVRNLSSYPPKIKTLDPPEKNIGAPGTVSTGTVEYRRNGKTEEPVWKGKVEFYVVGREAPVNELKVEKVCHWTGSEFAPLN
jgi:hypothetical protein